MPGTARRRSTSSRATQVEAGPGLGQARELRPGPEDRGVDGRTAQRYEAELEEPPPRASPTTRRSPAVDSPGRGVSADSKTAAGRSNASEREADAAAPAAGTVLPPPGHHPADRPRGPLAHLVRHARSCREQGLLSRGRDALLPGRRSEANGGRPGRRRGRPALRRRRPEGRRSSSTPSLTRRSRAKSRRSRRSG